MMRGAAEGSGRADRPMTLETELKVATELAIVAGAALRRHQAGPLTLQRKGQGEVVTAADMEADATIRAGLRAAFPGDPIFSEETPDSPDRLAHARVWIVDPLDSTSNFAETGDEYSVSIGLSQNGRAVLGVVYDPARDELIAGCRGEGVTLNGSPVRVSDVADLGHAQIIVSRREWRWGLDKLASTLPIRPMASIAYKLARVAAGLDDGMFSVLPRKQWDTCAGVALVLAAGGRATLLDGQAIQFNRPGLKQPMGMVAAGPGLHPILLEALQRLPPASTCLTRGIHV
jgi:myo-inositol-1(or 4)-monophosphatase